MYIVDLHYSWIPYFQIHLLIKIHLDPPSQYSQASTIIPDIRVEESLSLLTHTVPAESNKVTL